MDKQTIRFILLSIIIFLGFSLYSKHQEKLSRENPYAANSTIRTNKSSLPNNSDNLDVPNPIEISDKVNSNEEQLSNKSNYSNPYMVQVTTDLLKVNINAYGDIIFTELLKYPKNDSSSPTGFNLLDNTKDRFYIAQSGLLSESGPDNKLNGRTKLISAQTSYNMSSNQDQLIVDLTCNSSNNPGLHFIKRFTFNRNSYLVNIEYIIKNDSNTEYNGSLYGRLKRKFEAGSSSILGGGLRTYTGAAINTPEEKYKKLPFTDIAKKPYRISFDGGWMAMLEHYFVSAWIPDPNNFSEYQTEKFNDNVFAIRAVNSPIQVAPGTTKSVGAKLYIGPKVASILKQVSPALDLTIDYGVLWVLCVPLFWLLKTIFGFIGNWGWSIIFTTLVVKVLFYKLSAYSYRSMGNLRKIQPKIEELKNIYGADKQKFSQAIMELYRKEKVNPLGGCLPILLQIPVFIALYYVLLESVELRQASWIFWIKDLSAKDPIYILPVLMGISMFLQQKMNPPPADPIQAKVLMFMPALFSLLFLQFPSGLMLYWIVNNTLSILQQMFITRAIEKTNSNFITGK